MRINIITKSVVAAFGNIAKLVKTERVAVFAEKSGIWLEASDSNSKVRLLVEGEVHETGDFTVDLPLFQGLFKKHTSLDLELEDNQVNFRDKNYKGNFVVIPATEPLEFIEVESWIKDQQLLSAILQASTNIKLSSFYGDKTQFLMVLNKKGLTLAQYDQMHLAYYKNELFTSKKPITLCSPVENVTVLLAFLKEGGSLGFAPNGCILESDTFKIQLPVWQEENVKQEYQKVSSFLNIEGGDTIVLGKEKLQDAISNALSLYDEGMSIDLSVNKKNRLVATGESHYGKVQVTLNPCDKSIACKLDPQLTLDTLNTMILKEIEMTITDKVWYSVHSQENGYYKYICILI